MTWSIEFIKEARVFVAVHRARGSYFTCFFFFFSLHAIILRHHSYTSIIYIYILPIHSEPLNLSNTLLRPSEYSITISTRRERAREGAFREARTSASFLSPFLLREREKKGPRQWRKYTYVGITHANARTDGNNSTYARAGEHTRTGCSRSKYLRSPAVSRA